MVGLNVVNFVSLVPATGSTIYSSNKTIITNYVKEEYMRRTVSALALSTVFALSFGLDAQAGVTKADVDQYDLANGKSVYDASCASCHAAGIMGAPKTGTARKWTDRLPQGLATIVQKSIDGYSGEFRGSKTFMPAKGGNPDLTDQEVGDAVAYMINEVL